MPTTPIPPPRPPLYDHPNEYRARYYLTRYRLLVEDCDDEIEDWLRETVGEETRQFWGVPDTALNPLASATRQLTTPGLYGVRPDVRVEGDDLLVRPRGILDRAGFFTRAMAVQFFAVGLGVVWRHYRATTRPGPAGLEPRIVQTIVLPHDLVVWTDEDDPGEVRGIWRLRLRSGAPGAPARWTWDRWELTRRPDGGVDGYYGVSAAGPDGAAGEDLSAAYLVRPDGSRGALAGPDFPCLDEGGNAVLPWVPYYAVDDGQTWPQWRRSMHRGTLRAMTHWTYVSRSALFATGEHVVIGGVHPGAVGDIKRGDEDIDQASAPTRTMRIQPGTMTFVPVEDGKNLTSISIGPGVNLPNLASFANQYDMALHLADGLHPTDATRQSANPTSGAALEISSRSRREFSLQVKPLFERADLQSFAVCTHLLRGLDLQGVELPPADAYSIRYHTIPLTPDEQGDLRAQLDWEVANGHLSPVEAHLRLNPTKSRDQAFGDIVAARVEGARLTAAVEAALAELGLDEPTAEEPAADETVPGDMLDDETLDEPAGVPGEG